MNISWSPIQVPAKKRKNYARANWQKYQDLLNRNTSNINLTDGDSIQDIDEALQTIQGAIQQADSETIPVTSHRTLPHPSYSQAEKNMIQQMKSYYLRLTNGTATPLDWTQLKRTRYLLNIACKRNSKLLWDNKIQNIQHTTDSRKFWHQIKLINGTETNSTKFIYDNNREKIYKPAEQEPVFRQFWETIYKENRTQEQLDKASDNIEEVEANLDEDELAQINTIDFNRIQNLKFSAEEIKHTLSTFCQKGPGWDGITKKHLVEAFESIKQPITNCFNAALSCGYFPAPYKHTKLIFIPKPDKTPTEVSNYRPISLLSTTGKLLEKLLNKRLSTHLLEHEQYNPDQHGFRNQRGTETAIAMIWEAIAQGRKYKLNVCLTSRDIEKAFDRVWQKGLKFKLSQLNLHPNLLKILFNYLNDRTASIQIDNHTGPQLSIECGVPQGGCLSTTLFSIYTRDIPRKIYPWTQNTFYADDVTQVVRGKSYGEIKHVWFNETNNSNKFEDNWLIKTNMRKFKLLNIEALTKRNFQHHRYGLDCTATDAAKILGFTLTTQGMSRHITNNINKAKAELSKLWKLRNLCPKNKRKLYLMLVKPHLLYPCIPLHVAHNNQMLKLQQVQNKSINFILGRGRSREETSEELHRQTNLDPINVTLQQRASRIWWKLFDDLDDESIQQLRPPNYDTQTRTSVNFPSSIERRHAIANTFYRSTDLR